MKWSNLHGATEWALMIGLIFGTGAIAQAQEDIRSDDNVIQIGKSDKPVRPDQPADEDNQPRPAMPKYWIGLLGGPIPADNALRAHVDLPENQGLLVANLVPKSPAANAGLKQYDILLKGNGKDLREMKDLIDLVMSEGAEKGQITLDVLRHNKHESIVLKPEDRPVDAEMQPGESGGVGGGFGGVGPGMPMMPGTPADAFQQYWGGRMPKGMQFRSFGPGVIVGSDPFAGLPNGVSINVQKQNDKPARVTVQRGDDKWDIIGDDPEALKKLPEDLRPIVERMLRGGGGMMMGGAGSFRTPMPGPQGFGGSGPDVDGGGLREQLERMEKRLDEMQRRMHGPDNQPADKPSAEQGETK